MILQPSLIKSIAILTYQFLCVQSLRIVGDVARFHTGPAHGTWIRETVTTLILPRPNSYNKGFLAIWPGLDENTHKLIQTVAINSRTSTCDGQRASGKWILMASVYNEKRGTQRNGDCHIASPGNRVTIRYKWNSENNGYDQTVYLHGKIVSTFSTIHDTARGRRWYTAIECQKRPCGVVPRHRYVDTTIVLDAPDPQYGDTVVRTGSRSTRLVTHDGGKTWRAKEIIVESHTFR